MPKLTIDNITVEVPVGSNVLEAARKAGIIIPHFCYHPALGSVGACRLCAMKFLDGPVKGIQMSCMIPAQDDMVVSTIDEEAAQMRKLVIEWLMLNHPHDCPVCDEGGECLLQDYTVAGGHGIRRYEGKKRTHLNQDLGPYIEHEMNRCIQCYRCVRFYQDYAGGRDFGVMGSAAKVYFGRFRDGTLESPFSGNLADICPTGVFTDKTARFRARYWDYDMAPSVCPGCSLGCNTVPVARYRELLKIKARPNNRLNGWFICDSGRFGNSAVNDPARPRIPLVDGRETGWDEALDDLTNRINEVSKLHGPDSIALVGSPRLSLEGNLMMAQLAGIIGTKSICFLTGQEEGERCAVAVSGLTSTNTASQQDVREADCIAIVDSDLLEDGPMLALAVRQAWRNGAPVFLVGRHAPLSQAEAVSVDAVQVDYPEEVPFGVFKKPVIICGTRHNNAATIKKIMASGIPTLCLLPGPNTFAAALLSHRYRSPSLSELFGTGRIRGVISFEADIPGSVLHGMQLVAAADWLQTEAVKAASIFLPTTCWMEMDGTFVNHEGRAQRFKKVMNPGEPLKGHDPGLHPPREHRKTVPGGDPRPAWQVVSGLMARTGSEPFPEPLKDEWQALQKLDAEGEGMPVNTLFLQNH